MMLENITAGIEVLMSCWDAGQFRHPSSSISISESGMLAVQAAPPK